MDNTILEELMQKPLPKLTTNQLEEMTMAKITAITNDNVAKVITNNEIQTENGYVKLSTGGWLVATSTFMPNVTAEMINWWFWWHAKSDLYYKVWYPSEHFSISVKEKEIYNSQYKGYLPLPTTHYPVERVGKRKGKIAINFINSKEFGISNELLKTNNIATSLFANVGLGILKHTKMVHLFRVEKDGLTIISRFWMGEKIPKLIQRKLFTEEQAKDMMVHCKIEYTRLAEILPTIYDNYYERSI